MNPARPGTCRGHSGHPCQGSGDERRRHHGPRGTRIKVGLEQRGCRCLRTRRSRVPPSLAEAMPPAATLPTGNKHLAGIVPGGFSRKTGGARAPSSPNAVQQAPAWCIKPPPAPPPSFAPHFTPPPSTRYRVGRKPDRRRHPHTDLQCIAQGCECFAQPCECFTQPCDCFTQPCECFAQPCECFTQPCECFTQPCDCFTQPCDCFTQPCDCFAQPCDCFTQPCKCFAQPCEWGLSEFLCLRHHPVPQRRGHAKEAAEGAIGNNGVSIMHGGCRVTLRRPDLHQRATTQGDKAYTAKARR